MGSNRTVKKIRYALRFLPDKIYIQLNYFAHFKKFANLKNPKTYNEKLNWLKLYDRNPLYTKLVDKYEVKKYVSDKIGSQYIIPTLGVWDKFDEIDFGKLPNQFVLKCTHDSEGIVIVHDKSKFNQGEAKEKIEAALKQNFYYIGREYPYKNVNPRIIAEKYIEDEIDGELRDYKFFCFSGVPKAMYIASERGTGKVKFDYYDLDFQHLDIKQKYPNASKMLRKPDMFEQMLEMSKILSKDFLHVRVDFYEVNGKIYFGELTFYHLSGFIPFEPAKWDDIFGEWLRMPNRR